MLRRIMLAVYALALCALFILPMGCGTFQRAKEFSQLGRDEPPVAPMPAQRSTPVPTAPARQQIEMSIGDESQPPSRSDQSLDLNDISLPQSHNKIDQRIFARESLEDHVGPDAAAGTLGDQRPADSGEITNLPVVQSVPQTTALGGHAVRITNPYVQAAATVQTAEVAPTGPEIAQEMRATPTDVASADPQPPTLNAPANQASPPRLVADPAGVPPTARTAWPFGNPVQSAATPPRRDDRTASSAEHADAYPQVAEPISSLVDGQASRASQVASIEAQQGSAAGAMGADSQSIPVIQAAPRDVGGGPQLSPLVRSLIDRPQLNPPNSPTPPSSPPPRSDDSDEWRRVPKGAHYGPSQPAVHNIAQVGLRQAESWGDTTDLVEEPVGLAIDGGRAVMSHRVLMSGTPGATSLTVPEDEMFEWRLGDSIASEPDLGPAFTTSANTLDAETLPPVQLAMLRLVAGDLAGAQLALTSLPMTEQSFWASQLAALAVLMDDSSDEPPAARSVRRTERARHGLVYLRDACRRLGEMAPLRASAARFCRRVDGFGQYELATEPYKPGQPLLIYCQVDNLGSRAIESDGAAQFQAALQARWAITNQQGVVCQQCEYPVITDTSREQRGDFYIHLPLTVPALPAGTYHVALMIDDLVGGKSTMLDQPLELVIRDDDSPQTAGTPIRVR
jgi:hypothetical protein